MWSRKVGIRTIRIIGDDLHGSKAATLQVQLVLSCWSTMTCKVVLITGCSKGGIGFELCRDFHLKGHKVFATARDVGKLDGLPEDIGRLQMDVTSTESVEAAVQVPLRMTQLTYAESHR
jgi:hypothetical protein